MPISSTATRSTVRISTAVADAFFWASDSSYCSIRGVRPDDRQRGPSGESHDCDEYRRERAEGPDPSGDDQADEHREQGRGEQPPAREVVQAAGESGYRDRRDDDRGRSLVRRSTGLSGEVARARIATTFSAAGSERVAEVTPLAVVAVADTATRPPTSSTPTTPPRDARSGTPETSSVAATFGNAGARARASADRRSDEVVAGRSPAPGGQPVGRAPRRDPAAERRGGSVRRSGRTPATGGGFRRSALFAGRLERQRVLDRRGGIRIDLDPADLHVRHRSPMVPPCTTPTPTRVTPSVVSARSARMMADVERLRYSRRAPAGPRR